MKFQNKIKKSVLACAVLLSVLSLGTIVEAAKVNIVANTSGGSYRTNIEKTVVHQAVKDGDITLGNQINFGTYQQSSNGSGVFNIDPVAWIVVEKNTGGTAGRYTLVSTKVLDAANLKTT
ncbi:MAG: hypothetical protein MJ032_04075 [Acidaminococcaceae bacterium]|nr:hypothetical protein [Acidaminococcaceae bacterium]